MRAPAPRRPAIKAREARRSIASPACRPTDTIKPVRRQIFHEIMLHGDPRELWQAFAPVVARDLVPTSSVREEETPEDIQQTVGPSLERKRLEGKRDIPLLIHNHGHITRIYVHTDKQHTSRSVCSSRRRHTRTRADAVPALVAPIVRHAGVVFDGEQGKKYAAAIGKMVESVQTGLEEVHSGDGDSEDLRFLRIRTKRHEIMISPDDRYLLAVLYDPST
uniref:Roadblock/LAMTOR2 domain-containing protein n=1 Tax=Mycena chlorophos TaxID=658473 RepID=A0ABQ0LQQ0_MYCCL|nr:predicted protein [Mycena chlorophos]